MARGVFFPLFRMLGSLDSAYLVGNVEVDKT